MDLVYYYLELLGQEWVRFEMALEDMYRHLDGDGKLRSHGTYKKVGGEEE